MLMLRPMSEDDVAAVAAMEKECFSDAWSEGLLQDMLKSPYDEAWVMMRRDGILCGYLNVRFLSGEGELMRIAVKKEFRGHGLSRKLMDQMVKSAKEKEVFDLTLEVRAGNKAAINLYKSYGFKKEAVRRGYYHNLTEDAFIMWRRGLLGITT